ncbi:MAG: DUF5667 domain-containing protein [Nocardioides sp.]
MSPFATRRRAEEFEAVVDGSSTPRMLTGASDTRYDDLLVLVGALRAVPQPQARPEFVAELRERLLAEAATLPAREATETERLRLRTPDPGKVRKPREPRERRLAVAMGGLALVGATATLSVAAQGALPGDVLYPLKRGIESAHAGLSIGDEGKGNTLLASASTRLDEVTRLGEIGAREHETEIAETLDDFTAQSSEASDLLLRSYADERDDQTVTELRTFAAASMRSLSDLDGRVPESAQDEYVHAVTTLVRIDDEATLACPSCEGVDVDELAPELPTVGTGFGTDGLPAVNLADAGLPTLVLPSLGGELPPGSVTEPSPGAGPSDGPAPTGLPTGVPTSGLPTALPTAGSTSGLPLPTVDVTQVLDELTGGPGPLPSVGVTQLLGGAGSAVNGTLDDLLP